MSDKKEIAKNTQPLEIDFNCPTVGRCRTIGEIMCMMLVFENDVDERASVLANVMENMGVSIDDIRRQFLPTCSECGMRQDLCDCDVKENTEGQKIAQARDKFFKENAPLLKCAADGEYLKNRLEVAFIAGWNACRKAN